MSGRRDLDGFHVLSGVLALIGGPIMLAAGAPAGWATLVLVIGVVLLIGQWMTATDVTFEWPDRLTVIVGAGGTACIALAVVYFTRAAGDLPTVLPGYEPGSERLCVLPGILLLAAGAVTLGRAIANVHPTKRAPR